MNVGSQWPLVSIVTPVYNEARYLAECIESVLGQTYANWDYAIVDNCSTDGTLEIARRYAAKDPRIRVYQNAEFLAAIPNHNAALRRISPSSRYCKIVFGDDVILPECIERMVAAAEAHPSAGVVSAYALEGDRVMCTGLPYPRDFVSGREVCRRHLLENVYLWGSANTVMYRADLVRRYDPFYNETNIHSDTEICFKLLKESDFGFVHQVLTVTRSRPGSLSTASTEMGTSLGSMLHLLVTYGPDYLTPDEVDAGLARHLLNYYQVLGKNLLLGRRTREFWVYHRSQLTGAGVGYRRPALLRGALLALGKALLTPRRAVGRLLSR
jgi:glycosyltransferase involved in cell wall biosynthesis